jgi:hypothetical protein
MKKVYRSLFVLHLLVGTGAMFGGLTAIINPQTPFGIPSELLRNSPFSNYLIPGIILFTVIGLGNIFSAFMFHLQIKLQGYISSVFSWALVIWIVVQCIILNTVAFPHVLFFIIGLIQAALSMAILFEKRLFPTNIVIKLYRAIMRKS